MTADKIRRELPQIERAQITQMKRILYTLYLKPYTLFLHLTLYTFVIGSPASAEAKKNNPHREQKYCLECHTKEGYRQLKKPTLELCVQCHQEIIDGGLHPLEGLHNRTTSTIAGLPLKEGKIVCITCHEPCTRTVQGEPDGKTEHYGLLRKEPNELCLSCHLK